MLVIYYGPEFLRDYKKLTLELRVAVKERGRIFQQNPHHPLLRTHKLGGYVEACWAFSVDYHIRILFEFRPDGGVNFLRIGDHSMYARLRGRR